MISGLYDLFVYLGKQMALNFQNKSSVMTDTDIISSIFVIPQFDFKKQYLNSKPGYVCKTESGNVVKLLIPYDSLVQSDDPERLPSNWKILWGDKRSLAKDFMISSSSPYHKGRLCRFHNQVYKSLVNNNLFSPEERPDLWEMLSE